VTRIRTLPLFLAVAAVAALTSMPGSAAGPGAATVRLKSITAKVGAKGSSLVIEATEPVPYLASAPDVLTLLLDLQNVTGDGVANTVKTVPGSPISSVAVEAGEAAGTPTSRIRVGLTQPVGHRVRADRNTIVVDFDAVPQSAAAKAPPVVTTVEMRGTAPRPDPMSALKGPSSAAVSASASAATTSAASAPPPQQSPSPLAAGAVQPPAGQEPRRYTGARVSFDFDDADLRLVLRGFQEISGLNIVIDSGVQGTVNLVLRDVPWDQALDVILKQNKLGYIVEDTIVRIAPLAALAEEQTERKKLADAQALSGELEVRTRRLSYAKADELQTLLKQSGDALLSKRGTVQVDQRTNTLIVTDLPDRLNAVDTLLSSLDRAQPQVEIEARIVQTNKNYARQLGIQWGFSGRMDPALGNTSPLAFPNNGSVGGRLGPQGPNGAGTAVNLPVGNATSAVGLALGSINGAFNLDVALSALEQTGKGTILATPRVSTLNNVEAEMTQGVQIPLQTIANNTVTVQFKDAALTLKVTPQITEAGTVIMHVSLENATPDFSRAAGPAAIPPINTQRAITTLLVNDGETTVIGGIYTSNQQSSQDRTPGLSQIPLISWLFKRDRIDDQSSELLVFITPRIIKG
jgi:type IV pilus assembly protein PilQ